MICFRNCLVKVGGYRGDEENSEIGSLSHFMSEQSRFSRVMSVMAIFESAGINRYEAGVEETLRDKD
jgi:hypothetical protein